MSFDLSRLTDNPRNNFTGVVMNQGRVLVDSDWNAWMAELARRNQAGTLDTLGRSVVPQTTPHGFEITLGTDASGATIVAIGPGRMYVDGLLAENHGLLAPTSGGWTPGNAIPAGAPPAGLAWDPALAELVGANPVPYDQQPYLPGATFPTEGGPFLVYLDVWQREVTFIEYPDLVEKAVGVDTTGRLQMVWQVKWIDVSADGGVTCATPDGSIPEWQELLLPPGPRLTTGVVQSNPSGPCCLTPDTGYTGRENQFYRVEIHQGGEAGAGATFKWSRDNASIATGVTAIGQGGTSLVVQSIGRDSVLRFSPNDWIEITDDWQELQGQTGELHQISTVVDASSTITLATPVSGASYPVSASGQTDPTRHTRIRRWDQKGKVYQSDGVTEWADLNAAGAGGAIPVPPAGTTLVLEDGVTVSFSEIAGGAPFQPSQFWNFAARSTDGTVEFLNAAPPRGIHHHYARLSVVSLPSTASDCRSFWPPSSSGDCCGCTIAVQPSDLTGNTTLQTIVDGYQNRPGPTTFCLSAGEYLLDAPLSFTAAHNRMTIEACQPGTVLIGASGAAEPAQFADGLIVIDGSTDLTFHGLGFLLPSVPFGQKTFAGLSITDLDPGLSAIVRSLTVAIGLRTVDATGLTVRDCTFDPRVLRIRIGGIVGGRPGFRFGAGIFSSGNVSGLNLKGNVFRGGGDFSAGFLMAPSAYFVDPKTRLLRAEKAIQESGSLAGGGATASAKAVTAPIPSKAARDQKAPTGTAAKISTARTRATKIDATPSSTPDGLGLPAPGAALPSAEQATGFEVGRPSLVRADFGGSALGSFLSAGVVEDNTFSNLSIAVLVLASTEALDLVGNRLTACEAGFWLLSTSEATSLALEPQGIASFGLSLAIGYPLPRDDQASLVIVGAAPPPVRVYAGPTTYVDSSGDTWTPDLQAASLAITASNLNQPTQPRQIAGALPGTADQALYQSERWGTGFTYTFSGLPAGFYTVTLKLAEIFWSNAGQRVFNVAINGIKVIADLDLIAQEAVATAEDQAFSNIASVNGQIVITFTGTASGSDPDAKSGAIEISPQWSQPFLESLLDNQTDDLQTFYAEIAQLAQQAYAAAPPRASRVRVDNNEMQALSSMGLLVLGGDLVQSGTSSSLMVTGNRLGMLTGLYGVRLAATVATPSRLFGKSEIGAYVVSFRSVVSIFSVARCVVANNMIIGDVADDRAGSLTLFAGALNTPTTLVPPPEISVMGNILRGFAQITPPRSEYLTGVPNPMNTWQFLNTVVF